jgi:hypothetical protein
MATLNVGSDQTYKTLQEAVNAASTTEATTIVVSAGTYNEDITLDDVDVFIWGSPEGIIDFREETMTEDFVYWHIMPNKAIDITYGRFPIFIWTKEKNIIKIGDFRDLDDAFFKWSTVNC